MHRLELKLANVVAGSPGLLKQSACPPLMGHLQLYHNLDYPQAGPACVKNQNIIRMGELCDNIIIINALSAVIIQQLSVFFISAFYNKQRITMSKP